MQLQADILGVPGVRPTVGETTSLDAAYAMGLAAGVWDSLDGLRQHWPVERISEPAWPVDRRDGGYAGWQRAVERARGWMTQDIPAVVPLMPKGGEG